MNGHADLQYLNRPDGATIAYRRLPAAAGNTEPGVVFLCGLKSDMTGTKATALEEHCRRTGRAFVRFDYFGHGQSSGAFEDGTMTRWAEDAVAVIDELTEGPQVLVGSSMGGWVMLLTAIQRPERIAGMVGIAAAPTSPKISCGPSFPTSSATCWKNRARSKCRRTTTMNPTSSAGF